MNSVSGREAAPPGYVLVFLLQEAYASVSDTYLRSALNPTHCTRARALEHILHAALSNAARGAALYVSTTDTASIVIRLQPCMQAFKAPSFTILRLCTEGHKRSQKLHYTFSSVMVNARTPVPFLARLSHHLMCAALPRLVVGCRGWLKVRQLAVF